MHQAEARPTACCFNSTPAVRPDAFDPVFVRGLFDEMSGTYGVVNTLSSFGFCIRWRSQCVQFADLKPGMTVVDLMCGQGECWPAILRRIGSGGRIIGVDFSSAMCRRARKFAARLKPARIDVREEDALATSLPPACADAVVACFALKTFNGDQIERLAEQATRLLRPGGRVSMLEISDPQSWIMRRAFLFYVRRLIPQIGRVFLGNPDNYRMLGVYTSAFGDSGAAGTQFERRGFALEQRRLFFGCATGFSGAKQS